MTEKEDPILIKKTKAVQRTNDWIEINKDKYKEYQKEYYIKHKAKLINNTKEWQHNNPDKLALIHKKYYNSHKKEFSDRSKKQYLEKKIMSE